MIALPIEEMKLLKRYILLPMIMTAFERDKKILQAQLKTPGPYARVIDRAIDLATKDLTETRRAMRKTGMKVYEEESTKETFLCKTQYRGYHHEHSYVWTILATEAEVWMMHYLGEDVANSEQ